MKVQFLNAVRMSGNKNGKAYDFARVNYIVPLEVVTTEKYQRDGFGFETQFVDLDQKAIGDFRECKLGQMVDLILEPKPQRVRENWCIGLVK